MLARLLLICRMRLVIFKVKFVTSALLEWQRLMRSLPLWLLEMASQLSPFFTRSSNDPEEREPLLLGRDQFGDFL